MGNTNVGKLVEIPYAEFAANRVIVDEPETHNRKWAQHNPAHPTAGPFLTLDAAC